MCFRDTHPYSSRLYSPSVSLFIVISIHVLNAVYVSSSRKVNFTLKTDNKTELNVLYLTLNISENEFVKIFKKPIHMMRINNYASAHTISDEMTGIYSYLNRFLAFHCQDSL